MFMVAGASGRTGRIVAEALLARGHDVRLAMRTPERAQAWHDSRVAIAAASLDDEAALTRALAGAAGCYILLPEDPRVADFHGHRRRMADAIASAVRTSRVPHVVLLSAAAAVLPDGNGPAKDLHHAESALGATGAKVTVIRASYFQENILDALAPARHEGIYPSFVPADFAIPTIATRDVGRLAARCLLEPPTGSEVIDLVGPMYSNRQLAATLGAALGKSLRVVEIPAAAHLDVLMKAGLPMPFAAALAEMLACFTSGRVSPRGDRMVAGTTTVEEILPPLLAAQP
jgi:uncharacterized protein YbjT (DUF2867 family)